MTIDKEILKDIITHIQEPAIVVKTSVLFTISNQDRSLDLTIDYIEPRHVHITGESLQIGGAPEVYSISLPVDDIEMTDVVADGRTGEKIMRFEFLPASDVTAALIIQIVS